MDINYLAPLIARKEIFIRASPEAVWRVETDIDRWSQWHPAVSSATLSGPLAAGSVFHWKAAGLSLISTLQVVEPQRRIGWTGKTVGTRVRHIWRFAPFEGGTIVTTEESMEGWLPGLLKHIMPRFLDESLTAALKHLKKTAEAR